jgi:hypothetical protein
MSLRVLVTGSRNWTDPQAIADALTDVLEPRPTPGIPVLVHGGARGADRLADQIWRDFIQHGLDLHPPEVHRADWERYGRRAGIVRNAEMIAAGAAVCLAFPIGESRGTRHCMQLAEKAGIPVVVHEGPKILT